MLSVNDVTSHIVWQQEWDFDLLWCLITGFRQLCVPVNLLKEVWKKASISEADLGVLRPHKSPLLTHVHHIQLTSGWVGTVSGSREHVSEGCRMLVSRCLASATLKQLYKFPSLFKISFQNGNLLWNSPLHLLTWLCFYHTRVLSYHTLVRPLQLNPMFLGPNWLFIFQHEIIM